MKKITLLIALVTVSFGFSQNLITNGNFDSGTTGWSGNQATSPNIVTVSGNSYFSHNVVAAGNPWDANLSYVLNIPNSGVNYKLTFTAWSTANRVLTAGIGLNQDPWTNDNQNVNLTSTQQTFILNFTSNFASPTSRIFFDMGQATGVVNIDDVMLEIVVVPPSPGPAVAAPTPPARPAGDVISLFSDAYTNVTVDNWNQAPIWYPPTGKPVLDVVVATNPTKKIEFSGDGFIGVVLNAYNNATDMTHFHMDYWVPTGTNFTGKVLNPKWSNHATMSGETGALLLTNLPSVGGSWVSVDVPLSSFTPQGAGPAFDRQALKEFTITSNLGDVYIDNIYLHKNTVLGTNDFNTSKVKLYPNPTSNVLNIEAIAVIDSISIFNILGQEVITAFPNQEVTSIEVSNLQKGVYVIKTSIDGVSATSKFIKE